MSTNDLVVRLRSLGHRFGSEPPVDALRHVDLTVQSGDWMAIIGPSGSGKSTLLNILGLLDQQTEGTYELDGIDTDRLSDSERAGLRARRIGFVFQAFHLLPHRTALENIALAEIYRGESRTGRRSRASAALDRVGLQDRAGFPPTRLSGGERQRVAIARATVGAPSLLLCDEPTGNLDSGTTRAILALFGELNAQGLTIIMITHERDVAEHAGRQVSIVDGVLTEIR